MKNIRTFDPLGFNSSLVFKILLMIIFFTLSFSCRTYKEITTVPKKYVDEREYIIDESFINFSAEADLETLNETLSKFKNKKFTYFQPDEVKFENLMVIKTKNPLYDPNKWIKTKNPTYNKHKWYKKCAIVCIKTKNIFYDPKKWIKTKNPKYSPNKYTVIEKKHAVLSSYQVDAKVNGDIKLTRHDKNSLNLKIPIKVSGWVVYASSEIPLPTIVKTPYKGKLTIDADITFKTTEDWCIKIIPKVNYHWNSKLKLDFTQGLKLIEIDVTKLIKDNLNDMMDDFEEDLENSIDCEDIKNSIANEWKVRSEKITDDQYAIIKPIELSMSHIIVTKEKIGLYGGVRAEVSVKPDQNNLPTIEELPPLKIIEPVTPSISLSIPVETKYDFINKSILDYFNQFPLEIENEKYNIKGEIKVLKVTTFPSGKNLGFKMKFETQTNKRISNIKATCYFTGKYEHVVKRGGQIKHFLKFKIDSLAFSEIKDLDDKIILTIGYDKIYEEFQEMDDLDVTRDIINAEKKLIEGSKDLFYQLSPSSTDEAIEPNEPEIRISDWHQDKQSLFFKVKAKLVFDD